MLRNWSLNPLAKVAIGILRKYGTDAHVYLPGIGTVSGLTAGNYLDSAGTTAATVDNPVGLSLDALQAMTLGDELITDWTSGWTAQASAVVSMQAGNLRIANGAAAYGYAYKSIPTVAGKTYMLPASFVFGTAGTSVCINVGTISGGSSDIAYLVNTALNRTFVALDATTFISIYAGNSVSGNYSEFYGVSVREIPGIHATQATTANKGLLRLTSGKYNWVFDATDLLTATYPAGNESVTVIDSFLTGQVTTAGVNVVGAYSMGPSVTLYGRMIIKGSISASDLLVLQRFANSLAGL